MFTLPIKDNCVVTLGYGAVYDGLYTASNPHNGIDYGCPTGTQIICAGDGVVSKVGYDKGGYGNYLTVSHKDGYMSLYAHLERAIVTAGQEVVCGQVIGLSGNTGNSTGPHLHFEIRKDGKHIDPDTVTESKLTHAKPQLLQGNGQIICDFANIRETDTMRVIGQLPKDTQVEVLEQTFIYNGITYRLCKIAVMIAECDGYGTQILSV